MQNWIKLRRNPQEDWKIADPDDPDQLYRIMMSTGSIGVTFGDAAPLRDGEFLNDSLIDYWSKYRTNTLLPPKRRETFLFVFRGDIRTLLRNEGWAGKCLRHPSKS